MDFGRQVGVENQAKIDPKRHRKSDENKKVAKMAKKSLQERAMHRDSGFPGPQGGGVKIRWRPGGMCGAQLNQKMRRSCGKKLWGLDNLKHAMLLESRGRRICTLIAPIP